MLLSYLIVCAYALAIVLLHEAGHYMAAISIGVRPNRFEIGRGPVIWRKGIFVFRFFLPAGGRVNYADENWGHLTQNQVRWIALGGPIVSILTGLVILPIIPIYGLMSLFCGITNLIPFPANHGQSDGSYVFQGAAQVWTSRLLLGTLAVVLLVCSLWMFC